MSENKELISHILGDAGNEKAAGGSTSDGGLKGSAKSAAVEADCLRKDGAAVSPRPTGPAAPTTDYSELVKRLRAVPDIALEDYCKGVSGDGKGACICGVTSKAADALEAQAAEIERLTTNGIHTCHDECQRPLCKSYREIVAAKKHGELLNKMLGKAEAERDRLKAALEIIKRTTRGGPDHVSDEDITAIFHAARKALASEGEAT